MTLTIQHILVPTDFSDPSDHALAMAIDLARAFDARLTLLHVWTMPNTGYADALNWPIDGMEREAQRALADALAITKAKYPKAEAVLREGHEWREIMAAISESACDLVVMGTHGRRGLPRLVLGSIAEKVVRASSVPVLTVGEAAVAKERKTKKDHDEPQAVAGTEASR